MSKSLSERLDDAKKTLDRMEAAITGSAGKLGPKVEKQFRDIATSSSTVDHWKQLLEARVAARAMMDKLEDHADKEGRVPYGATRTGFGIVRLLGVQSYLAAQWALADGVVEVVGRVCCIRSIVDDPSRAPGLVKHFIGDTTPKKETAAFAFQSLRESFGWPVAVSYALRNSFLHEGAGRDFFDGPGPEAAFKVSADGWSRIEEHATNLGLTRKNSQAAAAWENLAGTDLREILDKCEPDLEQALGVLLGSACESALVHVKFMLAED